MTRLLHFLTLALAVLAAWVATPTTAHSQQQWDYSKLEFIVVSGGPALRQWEDLRVGPDQHDRWWGNFIRSARIRMQAIRRAHGPTAKITWMVYEPGYRQRFSEDAARGKTDMDLGTMGKLTSVRDLLGLNLVWFSTGNDVIRYINSRRRGSIANFEYFGHSNRHCFLFDYSGEVSGASVAYLHEDQLGKISGSVFWKNATIKSWGCHTAESFSAKWKRAVGLPMEGAIGKTDYSVIVDHVSLPRVDGRWSE